MTPFAVSLARTACVAVGSASLLLSLAVEALGDDSRRFRVVNATGLPISQLVLSPHGMSQWGPNLLGVPTLPTGDAREIVVPPSFVDCNQDIKVAFQGNDAQPVWEYLNICNLQRIKLIYDAMSGVPMASYDE